jgi:short-subunit dehydrogenase
MFYIDDLLWYVFAYVAGWIGIIGCLTYAIMQLLQQACKPQDLKAKYKADWALVTGASSGIGKAIAIRLAEQKINVVLVALDDPALSNTTAELRKKFPALTFRPVGVNLGKAGEYMGPIVEATKDIEVNLVFNNAGYILPGLFAETDLEKLKMNFECNATCAISITHHFLRLMQSRKSKGLITFTSSAAAYLLGPTATMYSCSKAFLTNFAITLAAEVKDIGIDVVVVHPSPINSSFYEKTAAALSSLRQAQKGAAEPDVIAVALFSAAGRIVVWEQGVMCAIFRILNKILDFAFFTEVASRFAYLSGDHQKLRKASKVA